MIMMRLKRSQCVYVLFADAADVRWYELGSKWSLFVLELQPWVIGVTWFSETGRSFISVNGRETSLPFQSIHTTP